jgi:hypothetical protein
MSGRLMIQIQLTREQELQLAAATGLLIGTLELNLDEMAEDGVVLAQVPEALLQTPPALAPEIGPQEPQRRQIEVPGQRARRPV